MFDSLLLLNKLGSVDIGFFVACAAIIVLIVAVYYLIPVFNKKQYREQRDNLKKREDAFRSNRNARVMQETASDGDVSASSEQNEVVEQDVQPTEVDAVCDDANDNTDGGEDKQ